MLVLDLLSDGNASGDMIFWENANVQIFINVLIIYIYIFFMNVGLITVCTVQKSSSYTIVSGLTAVSALYDRMGIYSTTFS